MAVRSNNLDRIMRMQAVDPHRSPGVMMLIALELPGLPRWTLTTFRCRVAMPLTLTTTLALLLASPAKLVSATGAPQLRRFGLPATLLLNAHELLVDAIGALSMWWTILAKASIWTRVGVGSFQLMFVPFVLVWTGRVK